MATLTLIEPVCTCCAEPATLIPRDDLADGMAACPASGQLHRPSGQRYEPAALPTFAAPPSAAPSVQIDLSRSGYA